MRVSEDNIMLKIERYVEEWPDARWGRGHIVLDDQNFEDASIESCLSSNDNDESLNEGPIEEFLRALLIMPEAKRWADLEEWGLRFDADV